MLQGVAYFFACPQHSLGEMTLSCCITIKWVYLTNILLWCGGSRRHILLMGQLGVVQWVGFGAP